jgi:hypothetical protein
MHWRKHKSGYNQESVPFGPATRIRDSQLAGGNVKRQPGSAYTGQYVILPKTMYFARLCHILRRGYVCSTSLRFALLTVRAPAHL